MFYFCLVSIYIYSVWGWPADSDLLRGCITIIYNNKLIQYNVLTKKRHNFKFRCNAKLRLNDNKLLLSAERRRAAFVCVVQ